MSVPADDKVTSVTAIGQSAQNGAVAFTTTQWSVVLTAQERSPAADEALEKLCRTYWWPLYGFVRRKGYSPEEAQDLTQGFFALLLERRDFDVVRREKGRLRSYLLVSLKNFLAKARRRELTVKRGEGRSLVPLDELLARERGDLEPASALSADNVYERRWALTLLEQVLARLEEEYRVAGKRIVVRILERTARRRIWCAFPSRYREETGHDRTRGEASILSLATALPGATTRGDRAHCRSASRCRRRAPAFHFCSANVTWAQFSDSTS